ncbi:MAG: HAMP domain-containing protein, partial [Sphingobacteriaceae bacterium]
MTWFNPGPLTVASFAEFNIAFVLLVYTCSLRNKTRSTYVVLTQNISFCLYCLASVLYNPAVTNYSFALYLDWIFIFFQSWFIYSALVVACLFHRDLFPKQSKIILSLFAIITLFALYLWFAPHKVTTQQTPFNVALLLIRYLSITALTIVVFIKKIQKTKASQITVQDEKAIKAYNGFLFSAFLTLAGIFSILFNAAGILSTAVQNYIVHTLTFCGMIIYAFTYYDYIEERTSFQFRLVCIVLFAVHLILGLMPFALLGDANPNSPAYSETVISGFLIFIPVVTLAVIFLLPLFLRNNILKPLDNVMQKIKQVNAGDLSGNIKIEVNDEIGLLTENFNRMNTSLRHYAEKMNDLVDEKTNELNQSLQELKATQAQLIQSEKMSSLGELTAGIAHEIQNPLNFVNNFSEVSVELIDEMAEELEKGEVKEALAIATDIKQNLEKIRHHGKRADGIVKGMLQHSRNNSGERQLTDLNNLADEYLRLSYHGLRAKDKTFNATMTTHFQENLPQINIVPQDIGRVL